MLRKNELSLSARARYSIICAVGAFLILPIPLMVLGPVFGVLAIRRGEVRLGAIGLASSILFGIVGVVLV